jgi:hypothetical protein
MLFFRFLLVVLVCACASAASAQLPAVQAPVDQGNPLAQLLSNTQERIECPTLDHCILTGTVDIDLGNSTRFNADIIELFIDPQTRVVATGNVVFSSPQGRIAAERIEYNMATGTGVFQGAYGSLRLEGANPAEFGNQDPDVIFYGETIEKVGPRSYRISRGWLTTCVQPTPRWEIVSNSITIHLDDYAIARNMLLRVKGVPLFYLPVIYYPIQDDQRATGFLMPTYGTSTIRGQAISNAFFWALGRSQDVTFFHDWFTRAGQGVGAEYRYAAAAGSFGNLRFYRFGQQETAFNEGGTTSILPSQTSYQVAGSGTHLIGRNVRLYQRIDYATDVTTRQLYQQNLYEASNATRTIEGGIAGNWSALSASGLFQRTETFTGADVSQLYGSTPRLTAAVAPMRVAGAPVYVSVNGDYAYLPNRTIRGETVTSDLSVGRFDLHPRIQAALSRLTFLSVNTTAAYRLTQYNRSAQSDDALVRRYFSVRTEAIGPVLSKVWDTPGSGVSERMKHVIEPTFAIDHVSEIANASQVPSVALDASDQVVGGSMRFIYGLNNRFFFRARTADATAGTTIEYLTVRVQQTYYHNPAASRRDTEYVSSSLLPRAADLSNIAVQARVSPTVSGTVDATTRLEYSVHGRGLQVATTGFNVRSGVNSSNISFSRYADSGGTANSSLSGSTSITLLQDRLTGGYSLTWDIGRSAILNQSVSGTYLAQCCGIQMEFQKFKYPQSIAGAPAADRRFNVAVVLAGLGTFSNFFGAFDSLVGVRR